MVIQRTMKVGPGLLEIGEPGAIANLARRCTAATLTPEVSRDDPRIFLSGDTEPGARTEAWNLTGTLAQDYGETDSVWEFCYRHRGQQMPFRYLPDKTNGGSPIAGRLIVEAIALGGEVNTKPTSDFDFPLVGAPNLDTQPVAPEPEYDPEPYPEPRNSDSSGIVAESVVTE